jgi:hypothetical protein
MNARIQGLFNQAAAGMLRQGRRAVDDITGSCVYRAANGDRCGIGQMIPDELYTPEFEHKSVRWICDPSEFHGDAVEKSAALCVFLRGSEKPSHYDEEARFFREMQDIHDNWEARDWPRKLEELASVFNLDGSIVAQTLATLPSPYGWPEG